MGHPGVKLNDNHWWKLEGDELRDCLANVATKLFDHQSERADEYLRKTQLFENLQLTSADAGGYLDGHAPLDQGDDQRLLRSAVQTARAEIYSPQQPKGQILTQGASWKLRRIARRLDKIHEGLLSLPTEDGYVNVWAAMTDGVGMSALIQGMGVLEVTSCFKQKKVIHRCIRSRDVYFDPAEGKNPRTIYIIEPIELTEAQDQNPDFEDELEEAKPFDDIDSNLSSISRVIRRVRAYRIGKKGKPGKFAEIIGNTLVNESDFKAPIWPFVILHWEKHREGPYGIGLIEEGEYLAANATDLRERLMRRQRIASGKRVLFKEGAINREALQANDEEVHISVNGNVADAFHETVTPPFSASEPVFAENVTRAFWDGIGISQVSAAARREAGMETGVALRTLNNTKRGRQLDKAQSFELAFVQICRQHAYRVQELGGEFPELELKWPGARGITSVKISEALLGDDMEFAATLGPASAFTSSAAGRKSLIAELFSQQVITPAAYQEMLRWPDIDSSNDIAAVENDYIDYLIDRLLDAEPESWDEGSYISPEPFLQDAQGALIRTTAAYFKAQLDNVPEFNSGLLYRMVKDLGAILNKAAEAMQATQEATKFANQAERGMMQQSAQIAPTPPLA